MNEIIPAILVESEAEFERRLRLVEHDVTTVQVDVLDGTKFGHVSYHDARAIGSMKTNVAFELHLMVENPLAVVEAWKEHVPTLTRAIFHAELDRSHEPIIHRLKDMKLEIGMALNPETPVNEAHHDLESLDELLLMSVHPGASGQGLGDPQHGIGSDEIFAKIASIHAKYPNLLLGCDGGVDPATISRFKTSGITRFYVGSAIFNASNPLEALHTLQNAVL
ncbi:MAG: hypothetical protein UY81_C0035G0007 [Candidatus Giovannonibacteria bacterium GW2011_GWA2_53_7]|uniref:Ribulose-phosphate 3-epimerase n=1 Tax=Candidatus Giovannonibacteria bacterium GW2011_GWA2_53_7 TaxID=1618650 RepID=A0A0G1XXR2_9BACT|nr:MAG: hypothetical protein UY81_C0035G0007 [Candidatus Giovannonibacteria bacterium GW2011_GWA2_53_7]